MLERVRADGLQEMVAEARNISYLGYLAPLES
jgi:hypothetical protein